MPTPHGHLTVSAPLGRSVLRQTLFRGAVAAWFAGWLDFWGDLAWHLDPRREDFERAEAADQRDAYLIDHHHHGGDASGSGGNF